MAHCRNSSCSNSTTASPVTSGGLGNWNSLSISSDGLGIISYYDRFNGALGLAHCGDVACTQATAVRIDTSSAVGQHTSITIGADGLPLIVYHDVTNKNLKQLTVQTSTAFATLESVSIRGSWLQ